MKGAPSRAELIHMLGQPLAGPSVSPVKMLNYYFPYSTLIISRELPTDKSDPLFVPQIERWCSTQR